MQQFNDVKPCHKCGRATHWAIWSMKWRKWYRFCHYHIKGSKAVKL